MSQGLEVHFSWMLSFPGSWDRATSALNPWAQLLLQSVRKQGDTPSFEGAACLGAVHSTATSPACRKPQPDRECVLLAAINLSSDLQTPPEW